MYGLYGVINNEHSTAPRIFSSPGRASPGVQGSSRSHDQNQLWNRWRFPHRGNTPSLLTLAGRAGRIRAQRSCQSHIFTANTRTMQYAYFVATTGNVLQRPQGRTACDTGMGQCDLLLHRINGLANPPFHCQCCLFFCQGESLDEEGKRPSRRGTGKTGETGNDRESMVIPGPARGPVLHERRPPPGPCQVRHDMRSDPPFWLATGRLPFFMHQVVASYLPLYMLVRIKARVVLDWTPTADSSTRPQKAARAPSYLSDDFVRLI